MVMNKILFSLFFLCLSLSAYAVCPVCFVAVGAGIGFAQWLHVDDVISGLWVGGLTVSLIVWTINYLERKKIRFMGRGIIVALFYYLSILLPLHSTGLMWHMLNKLWGIDKLLLGIIVGSLVFFGFSAWYDYLKRKNNGHAYFPFQKVVMPVAPLIILSIVFYYLTK